jgi:hypothetical protein
MLQKVDCLPQSQLLQKNPTRTLPQTLLPNLNLQHKPMTNMMMLEKKIYEVAEKSPQQQLKVTRQ